MPKTFVNIDEVVKNWAWRLYDRTATGKQKRLRAKERKKNSNYINVNIDWCDVKFRDETNWGRLADDEVETKNLDSSKGASGASGDAPPSHVMRPSQIKGSNVSVLFQTKFTNNTEDQQEYTLRTEKTTRSSASTSVENGFTKGFDLGVTLKAPGEVFEANAGYHREFSLTNSEGETFEEELTWGVESLIKVKGEHVAEAELVVKEKKQTGDFTITTKISGTVYVTFNNIKDNNSFLKATGGDISVIIQEYLEQERRKGESMDFVTIADDLVTIKTSGQCKFRYGIKQEVIVNQKPLNHQ